MNRAVTRAALILFLSVYSLSIYGIAQTTGTITLKEGSFRLIRGAAVFQCAEGVRLRAGDLVETAEKGFAQVEFPGGLVIALGSSTRVMVAGQGDQFVLLNGWIKGESGTGGKMLRFTGPSLGATTQNGTILFHSAPDSAELFFESGTGRVTSPGGGEAVAAKPGQFLSRRAGKKTVVASRPDSAFIESMPLPFRDTLPSRLARFAKPVEPKPDHEVTYADIDPWFRMAAWRKSFVERFQVRLKDPAFRSEAEAHVTQYPEWDPILHPEKYEPATPATDQSKATDQRR